ncbi:hypothetical protein M9458_048578, partial [Cirrhinus mrigala]
NGSPFPICHVYDLARSTHDPEPRPPPPRGLSMSRVPELVAVDEPLAHGVTEQWIVAEPELQPATMPVTRENAETSEIAERSSAHCNMAEGELFTYLGLLEAERVFNLNMYADLPPLLPPSLEPSVTAIP